MEQRQAWSEEGQGDEKLIWVNSGLGLPYHHLEESENDMGIKPTCPQQDPFSSPQEPTRDVLNQRFGFLIKTELHKMSKHLIPTLFLGCTAIHHSAAFQR